MQRQKPQAIPSDVQAVAKALRKKEGGADEALRLVEHLPDKDALELLESARLVRPRRIKPFLVTGATCWILGHLLEFYRILTHQKWEMSIQFLVFLLKGLPLLCLGILGLNPDIFQNNLKAAIAHRVHNISDTNALDYLLRYIAKNPKTHDSGEACWASAMRLLARISDTEARALSPEARIFLHQLVIGKTLSPTLATDYDKIAAMLALAAVKDQATYQLIRSKLTHPSLREVAQSILEDW
ncbi:hypothetical protein [Armatimonas rosea]|uniref:Uncharacterized protein n=1 Tax=Armatimonas rosea TaxID=685828 RepID=A0A7W9SM67_ARMRO|nr:hypothetical protein [Armatimonas rosea]MBB6049206.1 hypothetical protein [Armatimonas rosea]